ncbi:hypothetical protein PR048_011205 [Dryococelus australis]|uniref:Uncharacterized protein n=1 Tax=Dryococelus australis TaxID=614101 RepID=A0ABQ9HLH6_9NEOP|nr:hypothetical protein PR048_011205 [Dryococelus australis]
MSLHKWHQALLELESVFVLVVLLHYLSMFRVGPPLDLNVDADGQQLCLTILVFDPASQHSRIACSLMSKSIPPLLFQQLSPFSSASESCIWRETIPAFLAFDAHSGGSSWFSSLLPWLSFWDPLTPLRPHRLGAQHEGSARVNLVVLSSAGGGGLHSCCTALYMPRPGLPTPFALLLLTSPCLAAVEVGCMLRVSSPLVALSTFDICGTLACSPPTKANQVQSPSGHFGFSQVVIVPDIATSWWVFSGISSFPHPCIPVLFHSHFISPSSTLKILSSKHSKRGEFALGCKTLTSVTKTSCGLLVRQPAACLRISLKTTRTPPPVTYPCFYHHSANTIIAKAMYSSERHLLMDSVVMMSPSVATLTRTWTSPKPEPGSTLKHLAVPELGVEVGALLGCKTQISPGAPIPCLH